MRRHSPVLRVVVFVRVVLLVVGEEGVELEALLEVLDGLETPDVLREVEVAVGVDTCADKSVPVNTLQLHVGMILLERKVKRLSKVDVRTLYCVHVLTCHFELIEVEVLREYFHSCIL